MARPSTPHYKYSPLDRDRRETRLIQYQGTVRYDGAFILAFTCKTISLLDPPKYLAISYPCGDVDDLHPIFIDDKLTYIYKNLDLALRDLRPYIKSQFLWSDAISINQRDDDEKSSQILQLQDVYMRAEKVLVWPGPGSSQLEEAATAIRELSQASILIDTQMTALMTIVPDPPGSSSTIEKKDVITSIILKQTCENIYERRTESLVQFFAMPWWKRVWILQEYALAKQVAFVCGDALLDLKTLGHAVAAMQHVDRLTAAATVAVLKLDNAQISALYFCRTRTRVFALRYAHAASDPDQTSLIRLLSFTTVDRRLGRDRSPSGENLFRSTDPRDRIFALLSIASDRERVGIRPDYTKSKDEVYIEAARALLMLNGKLDILSMRNGYSPDRTLPSWVPDWTEPILESLSFDDTIPGDQLPFRASRKMRAKILPSPPEILSLKALLVGRVSWVSGMPEALKSEDVLPDSRDHMIRFHQNILRMHTSLTGIAAKSDAQLEPFALTILGGQVWDMQLNQNMIPDVPLAIKAFKIGLGWLGMESAGMDTISYITTGARRLYYRQFIFLSDGKVGLATDQAIVGDSIYLIPGADVPFILRTNKSKNKADHFEIIGEAYVHGIMEGQFLNTKPDMTTIHLV